MNIYNKILIGNLANYFKVAFFSLFLLSLLSTSNDVKAQLCDDIDTTYTVDLTGSPAGTWTSPSAARSGTCCSAALINPNPPDNMRCVGFKVILDPDAQGIKLSIASGAGSNDVGTKAMGYFVNCGARTNIDVPLCVSDIGPHYILFCKTGNNPNSYTITSIAKPGISDPTVVSDACTSTISATGYNTGLPITWSSTTPGAMAQLSLSADKLTGTATYSAAMPASVEYKVCGTPSGACNTTEVCNTTTVFFVSTLAATILPATPTICFGGASVTLTATPTGGSGVYSYLWNTGATTQSISVNVAGNYSVQISDATSCPKASASTTVTAYSLPILANAGADKTSCANNPTVTLSGSVQMATGGIWSTLGTGKFSGAATSTNLNASYTPSATEITAEVAHLVLTTTGNGSCPSANDAMDIVIKKTPIVVAGGPQSVCANNASVALTGASVTNAGGGRWSGGTGTYFPNDSTLTATYTPSAAEITAKTVTLTLSSIQNGTCLPVTATKTITIFDAPTAVAGPPQTVCANKPAVTLAGSVTNATTQTWSGGSGGYVANANTLNAVYTPSATEITAKTATLTLTTTKAGCIDATSSMTITITDAPTVNAGVDRNVCGNNGDVILNGSITVATGATWTSNGTGSFTNVNANSLNATYKPSSADTAAGSRILTLTTTSGNGLCNAVSKSITITYSDAPFVDAGVNQTVCGNNATVTLNGKILLATGATWSGGSGTFNPNTTTLNATYTPSAAEILAGTAKLKLTTTTGNGLCNPSVDSMIITITAAPTANANIDQTLCANKATATMNGSVSVPLVTAFVWTSTGTNPVTNPNTLTASYTPSSADTAAGQVTLRLTTTAQGTCNPVFDEMVIFYTDAPLANAGLDQSICKNNATLTLSGSVSIATAGTWTGGTGTFTSSRNVLNPTYTPTAAEITAGTPITLTLTTTTGAATCNPVSDPMIISFTPSPTATHAVDPNVCGNNSTVNLNEIVTIATGGTWSNGCGTFTNVNSLTSSYTPCAAEIASGIAALKFTTTTGNGNCLPAIDTVRIFISPSPIAITSNKTVCGNNPKVNLAGSVSNASSFSWSVGLGTYNTSAPNTTINPQYTPDASEISAGIANITLTASRATCNNVTSSMTVTITPTPVVNAGPDVSVCGNNRTTPLSGSITIGGVASKGKWTSTGSGTFSPNDSTLNASYTPSNADTLAGSVTLRLTTTAHGTCIAVFDEMIITITDAPSVSANVDQIVCGNKTSVTLNGSKTVAGGATWSGGTGTFNPNANTLNAIYTPSAAEVSAQVANLTLTTINNGNCNAVIDQMKITITPAPVVDAGSIQSICANNATAVLSGSVTGGASTGIWTGGNGIFNASNTTLNASYTPTATEITAGSVTLALTSTNNGLCNQVTDSVKITITPAPVVDAGSDQSVCGNTAGVIMNGTVSVATGGIWTKIAGTGSFSNDIALNSSYVPSSADTTAHTVTLRLTSTGFGNCLAVFDQMTITFTSVPSANAGPNKTVCTNDLPIQLNGTGTTSSWTGGTGTFTPSRNVLNPTYDPSPAEKTAQTVTLTLATIVNGSCPVASDDITITIPPAPVVTTGPSQVICGDVSSVALTGTVTNAGGGQWSSTGTGSFTPSATTLNCNYNPSATDISGGGVTLTLTSTINGFCTPVAVPITLTITTKPTIDAGPDQTVCADVAGINLLAKVTVATGGTWTKISGTGTFSNANILNPVYTPSAADTAAHTVTLRITSTNNGTCNAVFDDITILITPAPKVSAGPDQTICADKASILLSGSITAAASGGEWTGTGSGTFSANNVILNPSYFPSVGDTAAHSVTLTLTTTGNGTCNAVSDQMILTINRAPVVNAGPDQTVCGDIALVTLNGVVANTGGGSWTKSGTGSFSPANNLLNASYDPSTADTTGHTVTLTLTSDPIGTCNNVSDQMIVTFLRSPIVNAGPDLTICGNTPTVSPIAKVFNATGVTWTKTGTGSFINVNSLNPTYTASAADTAAHTVTLTATSTGSGTCIPVSDNVVVTISRVPIPDAGPDQTVCGDVAGISLNGKVYNATGGVWSGGTGTFSPNTSTLNATYIPSAAERSGSTVSLFLTTSGNGFCNAVVDAVVMTITTPPTVNAGGDITGCADMGTINLNGSVTIATGGTWTTSGSGTFADANSVITTYIPSATDKSNGVAVLTLTTTGNGTCNAVNNTLTLNINPAPIVNAGPDVTICADKTSIVLAGSVTNATGGTWTSNGTGTFTPDVNTLTGNYFPSAVDTAAHLVRLILSSTGNGTCNAVTDTMFVTINKAPVVNAGSDITVCADVASVSLSSAYVVNASGGTWAGNGSGSFTPNSSTINSSYVLSALDKSTGNVTLTLTSAGQGTCNAVSDNLLITITPAPTVNAGTNQTVCATTTGVSLNATMTVATAGIWTTASGFGTFTPNNTTPNATFIPAANQISAGLATLRWTTTAQGTCNPVFSTVLINISPAPVVTPGPSQTVCSTVSSVALAGTVTGATGGTWTTSGTTVPAPFTDANALITTYKPSANDIIAGNVTLTLTSTGSAPCSAVSNSLVIGFSAKPIVDAGPSTLCTDLSGITLSGTVTNAAGGKWTTKSGSGTFTASANILNPKYTPSAADALAKSSTLYLTTTGNGPCAAVVDSIQVGIQDKPSANASVDQIVCADIGSITLNGSVSNTGGDGGGIWTSSGGGAFAASSTTLNATYTLSAVDISNKSATLTLTTTGNGICTPATDQMVVTITPAPTVNAGNSIIACSDIAGIPLSGAVTVATGGKWTYGGTGTFSPSPTTLNATFIPSAADTAAHGVTLTLTSTGNGTCNAVSNPLSITLTPTPTINAGADITVCADVTSVFFTATTTVASGVTWVSTGTGSFNGASLSTTEYIPSAADTTAGLVKLIATTTGNGTCNAVKDTVLLFITPAPTVTANSANACADTDTIQLLGTKTVASGVKWTATGAVATGTFYPDDVTLNAKYVLSAAEKAAALLGTVTVTVTLTTTGSGTCNEVSASKVLSIIPTPEADANIDQTVCSNVNVTLAGSVNHATGGVWSTLGSGTFAGAATSTNLSAIYTPSSLDTAAGSVKLVLTTTGGICTPTTDTMEVFFTPAPFVNAGPAVICQSAGAVNLDAVIANTVGLPVWSGGNGSFGNVNALNTTYTPVLADNPSTTITLTVQGMGSCLSASGSILLNLSSAPVADAQGDKIFCSDVAGISLIGIPTNASGGTWSTIDGTGIFSNVNTVTASATYKPSDADTALGIINMIFTAIGIAPCPSVTDTMMITLTPAPTVDAGPASVCANAPPVALNGSSNGVATAFVWTTSGTGGPTSFDDNTSLSTNYDPTSDPASSTITLTLTTTAQGTCNPVSDFITLFIGPPPTASAGGNQTISADSIGAIMVGSVTNASGGVWTTSGTGFFDLNDSTTLGARYRPSPADTAAHVVTLTLTTTGMAPCNPVSSSMTLFITPVPSAKTQDQTICGQLPQNIVLSGTVANATSTTWTTLNGTGTIATPNSTVSNYNITSADTLAGTITFVLTANGIGTAKPARDTMIVTIKDAPTVDAGPPMICSDAVSIPLSGTITTATGGLWTTTGTGTFAPNDISLVTNYIPAATDAPSVTLTLTTTGNGLCNPVSDNIILNIVPPPVVDAGADQGICADAGTITITGSIPVAPGTGIWTTIGGDDSKFASQTSLNTIYTMTPADTAAHIVRLVLTTTGNAPCNAVSDTVVINLTPAPVALVNAGNDTTVCESSPNIILKGTIVNADGGFWTASNSNATLTGVFTPNAFDLNATYLPSSGDVTAGTVTLKLESTGNGLCNPITDSMIVTITPKPTANAGVDDTVCADVAGVPLNGIVTTATKGIWFTSGSGTFLPNDSTLNASYVPSDVDTADRVVILTLQTVDNGACSAAFDNMELIITPAPTVFAGFDQTVCADADSVSLSGTVSIATNGIWSIFSGTGSFSKADTLNTVYRFSDADTAAHSVTLILTTTTGNGTCIPKSDTVVINITNSPVINAGPDQDICASDPDIALSGLVTVALGAQWTVDGTGVYAPNDVTLNTSYFTTDADTTAGILTFVLTSTDNVGCNTVRDTMVTTIIPVPIVDAGPDQIVCADDRNIGLNGMVVFDNVLGGAAWTNSGTNTSFTNPNMFNAIYNTSDADTASRIVILNLTSVGGLVCNPVVDNMRIDITPAPVVDAGPDQTVCADLASVNIAGRVYTATGGAWTTSGTGTFADDSLLTTSYTPSAADKSGGTIYLKLTSTGNGTCNAVKDSIKLTITPSPTITAPALITVCGDVSTVAVNTTVTVALGGTWTTSGTGTFSANSSIINGTVNYLPTAADKTVGTIALTLTTTDNGTCNAVSKDVKIKFTAAPTVNAGPDHVICGDSAFIQLNGSKTVAAGGIWTGGTGSFVDPVTLAVDPTKLNAKYIPSAADIAATVINLKLTTTFQGTCNAVSDEMQITITATPTVDAGPDMGVCADAAPIALVGTTTVATSGFWKTLGSGSFSPDINGLNRSYVLSAADTTAGSVSLVLTTTGNGTCKAVKDTIVIAIAPAPVVSTGGTNICSDTNGVDLNGAVYNASGGIWSTSGTGYFSPNNVTLNARYNPSTADISLGSAVLTLTSSGNGTCNAVPNTMNITITPFPVPDAGIDQWICRNDLTAIVGGVVPDPDVSYAWSTTDGVSISNSGIAFVTAGTDTAFVLTLTDSKGCQVTDTVNIYVVDPPAFKLDTNYCFAFGTPMFSDPTPYPLFGTFQWFRNDTLLVGENLDSTLIDFIGTYMIEYNYGSCSFFDTTEVTPLPVLAGLDKIVCIGNPTIVSTNNIVGGTYLWTENGAAFPGNNDSIAVTGNSIPFDSSEYTVKVTNTLGCENTDTIYVIPVAPPTINIPNIPSCIGTIVNLNAEVNDSVGWVYSWYKDGSLLPDTDSSIFVSTTGAYTVQYSKGECITDDTTVVTFYPVPAPSNESSVRYCNETDNFITLDAGPATPGNTFKYIWTNAINSIGDTLRTYVADDPGTYHFTITNEFNCPINDSIYVQDACEPRVYISQAFTPNGDPQNMRFYIRGVYFTNFSITIFNRWGEIIFNVENIENQAELDIPENNWDGNYRDEQMPNGVYPYIIRYEGDNEVYPGPYQKDGSVVLIR